MFVVAQGNFASFWSLILSSGPIAQSILITLLFFSIFSWSIIVQKIRFYKEVNRDSQEFYEHFRRTSSFSQLYQDCEQFNHSPLAGVFVSGYEELSRQVDDSANLQEKTDSTEPLKLLQNFNGLQRTLEKAAQTEMTTLEHSLSWLATTSSVTPFIGLLGTVIGIINAFQGLGAGGTTTIQAVAPGISEALVATAAGLFAAIPALIAYNHFITRLKVFGVEMDDFVVDFLNTVERSFINK